MANYELEMERSNVTPCRFLWYVKRRCAERGIDFEITLKDFSKEGGHNSYYNVVGDKKISHYDGNVSEWSAEDAAAQAEVSKNLQYDWQTYVLNFDGSMYNEICEFTFDDEKTGHGYFYTRNKED
jgi:hypothetical protein